MSAPDLTLAASYLHHIADHLEGAGVDVGPWLAPFGLDPDHLEDATLTLPLPHLERLLLDAEALAREPALGLFIGERLIARTHGFVGYAAMSSQSVRDLLGILERFLGVRISALAMSVEVKPTEVQLRLRELVPLGPIQRPIFEAVAMSFHNILDAVTMGACAIRAVAFPFPDPGYGDLARELLGAEVRYDQPWAGLSLPADELDRPLKMADPHAFQEAAEICERHLAELEASATVSSRVRRLLLEKQSGFPTLGATARRLHLTPRTLHRRLVAEGTSFRALLDDVRHRLACEHLRTGRSTVDEIAFVLGYADPANFRRAFKRWAGVPPSRFRHGA